MKQIFMVCLILLVTLFAGIIGTSCTCGEKPAEPPGKLPPTIKPQPLPEEGVYLDPTFVAARPGQELSFKIGIKPSGWGVSGCEINLAFAPSVLEVVNIEVGNFLGSSPIIGLKQVDNRAGVIRLALARVGETTVPSPPGTLASVKFKVLDSANSGTYELKLTKVGLANENFQDITNFAVQGASITITP